MRRVLSHLTKILVLAADVGLNGCHAELQQEVAELGMDLVMREDGSFALPPVLPVTGVTPAGSESDEPK